MWSILLAAASVAGGLVWALSANREPRYGGHSLSYWLDVYSASQIDGVSKTKTQSDKAIEAVRHIGTNAIPSLLAWLSYEPSPLRTRLSQLQDTWLGRCLPDWFWKDRRAHLAQLANVGFELLGELGTSAIPALSLMAKDAQRPARARNATYCLCAIGPAALDSLLSVLTSAPTEARQAAAFGITSLGTNALPAVPALLQCLRDPDEQVAKRVAHSLPGLRVSQHAILPVLTDALSDPRPALRAAVVVALSRITPRPDAVLPLLANCLNDISPEVRSQTAQALWSFGDAAIPALVRALDDPTPAVRERIMQHRFNNLAPAERTNATMLAVGGAALRSPDSRLRIWGIEVLLEFGSQALRGVPNLGNILRDPDPDVREAATRFLPLGPDIITNSPPAHEIVQELLQRASNPDRAQAYRALCALPYVGNDGLSALMRIAFDSESPNEHLALEALATLRPLGRNVSPAIPTIVRAAYDADPEVAKKAIYALCNLGLEPELSFPAFTNALASTNVELRIHTIHHICLFGPPSVLKPLVPNLTNCLHDADSYVRTGAIQMLTHIAPEITLRSAELDIRRRATYEIARRGTTWPPAVIVPLLQGCLADTDQEVRRGATYALKTVPPNVFTNAPPR